MGGKRSGKRQYLYVSVACLILYGLFACAAAPAPFPECPACPACPERGHLTGVYGLLSRSDFEGAMKESQDILARSPKTPPGDDALLAMGLISAHYANPRKDYQKALGYFMRIEKDFPRSPVAEEAKIWISVLQAFEKAKQVDLEIEEMKKELGR